MIVYNKGNLKKYKFDGIFYELKHGENDVVGHDVFMANYVSQNEDLALEAWPEDAKPKEATVEPVVAPKPEPAPAPDPKPEPAPAPAPDPKPEPVKEEPKFEMKKKNQGKK